MRQKYKRMEGKILLILLSIIFLAGIASAFSYVQPQSNILINGSQVSYIPLNQTYINLDGVNDYINLTNNPDLSVIGNWTIASWFKLGSNISNSYVWSFGNSTVTNNFVGLFISLNNYTLNVQNNTGGGFTRKTFLQANDTLWHFIAITYSDGTWKTYFDTNGNVLSFTNNLNLSTAQGGSTFDRGAVGALVRSTTTAFYNGSVDEFMFLNYSLEGTGIQKIYNESVHGNGFKKGINLFYFHGVQDLFSTSINQSKFNDQISWLGTNGYKTVTQNQIIKWKNGTGWLPDKPIHILFDDAHESVVDNGLPVMKTYGFIGDLPVITNQVGTLNVAGNFSTWANLTYAVQNGWDISSHTMDHTNLTNNNTAAIDYILNNSKNAIIGNLSITPLFFVHPSNVYNSTTMTECAIFYLACTGSDQAFNDVYHNTNFTNGELTRSNSDFNANTTRYRELIDLRHDARYLLMMDENSGNNTNSLVYGDLNATLIGGATWGNDGINISTIDYHIPVTLTGLTNALIKWSNGTNISTSATGTYTLDFYYNDTIYILEGQGILPTTTNLQNVCTIISGLPTNIISYLPIIFLAMVFGAILIIVFFRILVNIKTDEFGGGFSGMASAGAGGKETNWQGLVIGAFVLMLVVSILIVVTALFVAGICA
jgi:peptidoglycan/xylan/chitin deacetylase (PgdA/CDA1 family)